jgi:hypothetical protein
MRTTTIEASVGRVGCNDCVRGLQVCVAQGTFSAWCMSAFFAHLPPGCISSEILSLVEIDGDTHLNMQACSAAHASAAIQQID